MPRNGSGNFTPPAADFPAVATTLIEAAQVNSVINDISTALTNSISSNGETIVTADLPMNGKNHTNVGDADLRNEYAALGQVQDQAGTWCGTAGGTANALTLSPTPGIPAYKAGQIFRFKSGATANTGAVTFSISGLAAIAGQVNYAACVSGELAANRYYEIIIDPSLISCQIYSHDAAYPVITGEVGVKNIYYKYGHAKRYGLTGDGITDDTAAFINAETSCEAIKEWLYFPSGSYRINITTASINVNCKMQFDGGKIVLIRTSGTNRLDVRNYISAPYEQIFDLSNIVSTVAAWNALWDQNGLSLPIVFGFGTTTYNQWERIPVVLCPQFFGAVGTPGIDDTLPIQIVFDMHKKTEFITSHDVTQLTLRGNNLNIDFNNCTLNGGWVQQNYSSLLEIKCGHSCLKNIKIDLAKSQRYQCAIHWYTNDLNTYYVGYNRINGCYLENCYIGIVIGGLPSQTVFAAQNTVVASPLATNAPISESYIIGFIAITTLGNIFFNQPNGKIRVNDAAFGTPSISGFSAPAAGMSTLPLEDYSTITVQNPGSELSVTSSSLVTTDNTSTIPILTIKSGSVYLVNVDIEAKTQIRIKALSGVYDANGSAHAGQTYHMDSYLFIDSPANFGINIGIDQPLIIIEDKANGAIFINKSKPNAGAGYYLIRTAPLVMVTDTFAGLNANATEAQVIAASTNLINPYISLCFTDVNFRDIPWKSSNNNLIGLVRGVPNTKFSGVNFTGFISLDITPPADVPDYVYMEKAAYQSSKMISMPNVDSCGLTIAAAVTAGTDGGWTVTTTGAGTIGGVNIATGPLVVGSNISTGTDKYNYIIRMQSGTSGAGAIASIESPKVKCEQSKAYFLSFYIRTNAGAPAAEIFVARIKSYYFDVVFLSEEKAVFFYE